MDSRLPQHAWLEVESEIEIICDRTSEIQEEDLEETVGREEV